jgi:hypothetical protein
VSCWALPVWRIRFCSPIPASGLPGNANIYVASFTHQQGFNIGDTMTLTRKFLIRVAGSQDWIWVNNDNNKKV